MPSLLTPDFYQSVRKALDVSITEASLSDEIIDLPIYAGAAHQSVVTALPTVESLDPLAEPAKWSAAQAAFAYLTAARIAPALPQIVQQQVGDFRISREKWDAEAAVKRLNSLAGAALVTVTGAVPGSVGVGHFWTVAGRRGR